MAIPDSDSGWGLEDVAEEIFGIGNTLGKSLGDCFTSADSGYFNSTYKGDQDRLLNFRDYGDHHAEPPATPTGLSGEQVPTYKAKFTWNSVPEADGYVLYWWVNGGLEKPEDVGTFLEFTTPEQSIDDTVYAYVKAYNTQGYSDASGTEYVYMN